MKARLLEQGYEALKKTDRLSGEKKTHCLAENACIGMLHRHAMTLTAANVQTRTTATKGFSLSRIAQFWHQREKFVKARRGAATLRRMESFYPFCRARVALIDSGERWSAIEGS